MADNSVFLIDIDKVLKEKAPDKAKYIPRFVVSYLKHIVHQDELNEMLTELGDLQGVDFAKRTLELLDNKIVVHGAENLPSDDRFYTFVSNHPLGGADGLALGAVIGEHYQGKIKFLVNDLLMNLHGLAPFFIPINKTGKQSKDFPRRVEAGFASKENQLIMFPAGICSRKQNGVIKDLPWKKSICTSRSFAHQGITDAIVLEEAVANFASMCATKLRKQRCCCQSVTVFAHTSRFRTDVPCDMIHATMTLTVPTQANAEIINAALTVLRKNMRRNEGKPFAYKKAGVILWNITPQSAIQQDLFDPIDRQRQAALTKAIDEINRKNGYNTVRLASQGTDIRFSLLREHISKNFTTNINDVLVAKV